MAAPFSVVDLELVERNDPDIPVTLLKNGAAINLAGMTVECYFKDNDQQADNDPGCAKMSTTDDTITVTSAGAGTIVIHASAADLPTSNDSRIWRVDVVESNGKRHTCVKGKLTVDGI